MQGVNAIFKRDTGFTLKTPKLDGRELSSEHSDCFFDIPMYTFRDRYRYKLLLYWVLFEMPGRKARKEKRSYCSGTEGVVISSVVR